MILKPHAPRAAQSRQSSWSFGSSSASAAARARCIALVRSCSLRSKHNAMMTTVRFEQERLLSAPDRPGRSKQKKKQTNAEMWTKRGRQAARETARDTNGNLSLSLNSHCPNRSPSGSVRTPQRGGLWRRSTESSEPPWCSQLIVLEALLLDCEVH